MEVLRQRIERQVLSISGLSLGGIDFGHPPGDPGLFGPDSVTWRIHGDFTSMLCGGVCALLLQMLHPLALAGVWDHSNFRADMLGRLRRTSQFISGTTFGPTADAERLIQRVRAIHDRVSGYDAHGTPYTANDPALLVWVHVAETYSFLQSHLRYRNPHLSPADQDAYYREAARVAYALGAGPLPESVAAVDAYLQAMRPQLRYDARTAEVVRVLLNAPAPSRIAAPFGALIMQAGIDLLPDWAAAQLQLPMSPARRRAVRFGTRRLARLLRWAVRNGSWHRAMRRMGRL
ncbi:histidine kinase [Chimaeribacter californicus]|uniref:Histidine kinase n=1 Tax=Chimaeribacter californicus TaxID=2060067 RepID=A0A2N5DXC2_9GAMM|nr:oxygenase MpaB family protein [Chimaeribacter californicus]PLR32046.1 histidine kinase [Chimaeribacter californicus]